MGLSTSDYDAECTATPNRIPPWVLPPEEAQDLFKAGHGTAPDLIYARDILDTPHSDQSTTDKKLCTILLLEVGFCRDLGCDKKHNDKTEKYYPLVAALKKRWGRVEFVAIHIGHASTTLSRTLVHLTAAFSTARPFADQARASTGTTQPTIDSNAKSDYRMFKSLLDSLTDLFSTVSPLRHY
jgi:hypothetical protein